MEANEICWRNVKTWWRASFQEDVLCQWHTVEFIEKNAEKERDGRHDGSKEAMAMAMCCAYQRSIIVKHRKYFSFQIRNHVHTYILTYLLTYLDTYIHTYIHTYVQSWAWSYSQTYVEFRLFKLIWVGQVPLGVWETLSVMSSRSGSIIAWFNPIVAGDTIWVSECMIRTCLDVLLICL